LWSKISRICLGGALETDFKTLPEEMQEETRLFISGTLSWLEIFWPRQEKKEISISGYRERSGAPDDRLCSGGYFKLFASRRHPVLMRQ